VEEAQEERRVVEASGMPGFSPRMPRQEAVAP
jgi:hypothetical protein